MRNTPADGHHSNLASEYDSRFGDTLVQLEGIIRDAKDFIAMKEDGRVLDYACGTGLLSRVSFDNTHGPKPPHLNETRADSIFLN